jgi:orotate phosphoribosyltransferase
MEQPSAEMIAKAKAEQEESYALYHENLGHHLFNACYLTGEFKLRSGQISKEYFDKYRFESDPYLLQGVVECMLQTAANFVNLEGLTREQANEKLSNLVFAGLETGGIPLATAMSLKSGISAVFVRKQAKEYGTCQLAEGMDVKGKDIIIIEDVITTGGQVVESAKALRAVGANIVGVICVVDREQGGAKNLLDANIPMLAVYTLEQLKDFGSRNYDEPANTESTIIQP